MLEHPDILAIKIVYDIHQLQHEGKSIRYQNDYVENLLSSLIDGISKMLEDQSNIDRRDWRTNPSSGLAFASELVAKILGTSE